MNKLGIIILLLLSTFSFGQNKGTIAGIVLDKEVNNAPLPFANVFIKGTTIGATTEFEGNYSLQVNPGTYTLVFSFIGYQTIEVPNVIVKAGETTTVNKTLSASEGVSLSEIQITASNNKESETALLTEQRKAISIDQKIGAQELARKGISDVASALTKTTGISKEEGSGGVFVRGLGDRYNVTTLNGLPLPSNNPSKKNIDLDIFSTDIVEYIGIDKTYSTANYGDFAGANVNIASKNYKGNGFIEMGIESGVNAKAISADDFYLNDG
ncbi:MAG: TonB-dependent receptor, partial [Lutibacter sp.]